MQLFSHDDKADALRRAPLFQNLSRGELVELAKRTEDMEVEEGKVLAREGDLGSEFFVVVDGEVAVSKEGRELRRAFPESSVENLLDVVTEIQEQAAELSVIGGIGLIWAALGFFSVIESAFNIVYGLPNRPFIRQKGFVLVLTAAFLVVLFVALVIASVGVELAERAGVASGAVSYVYALVISTALLLGLTWALYRLLTNTPLTWSETLPGAVLAAVFLQASFQVLPLFVRLSRELVALQAYGGLVLLLVWLYLMANILVFGAEVNWWLGRGRRVADEQAPGVA